MRRRGVILSALLVTTMPSQRCDGDGGGLGPAAGEVGGPCYPDGTCDTGLACEASRCVEGGSCGVGENRACACPGASSGLQICGADARWGACDCGDSCGDAVCGSGEDFETCPEDCPAAGCGGCGPTETCYDTICHEGLPPCLDPASPEFLGADDTDLEPNGWPEVAVTLPCGDADVAEDPPSYQARCPNRQNYTNGFMSLAICPAGESDVYRFYLLGDEVVTFQLLYRYDLVEPRDLDLKVSRYDDETGQYVDVAAASSTDDNEELTVSTDGASGNPPGWYYLIVHGKTAADVNRYVVSFTINPPTP